MKFPIGYALSFSHNNMDIDFFVQGEPEGELCITCQHPLFSQRFNGGTKCFNPFISAPLLPNETDANYAFFLNMKLVILKAYSELSQQD